MKYMIQFKKQGYMCYTSHLDLVRLFKRAFNRVGIPLEHSQGFNPHPKMSFAQPLSLGYSSVAEYLEFDTIKEEDPEDILSKLRGAMPEGIEVTACMKLPRSKKTVASLVTWADYTMSIAAGDGLWQEEIDRYLAQEEIFIEKKKKKGKRKILVQADIKPLIAAMKALPKVDSDRLILSVRIASGSENNLNPEALLQSFAEFAKLNFSKEITSIERREIYFTDWEGNVKSVMNIQNELMD